MSNNNNANTNTSVQQVSNEKVIENARKTLDKICTGKRYDVGNKMRKKLKRWFDRCKKKNAREPSTQKGELCYKVVPNTGSNTFNIMMGKKAAQGTEGLLQYPYLKQDDGTWYIIERVDEKNPAKEVGSKIQNMSYEDFYKQYKYVVGLDVFRETFWDLWDGFTSVTQLPRQAKSKNYGRAESVGGHVANIASRVFSPVLAASVPLCRGVSALQRKLSDKVNTELNNLSSITDDRIDEMKNYSCGDQNIISSNKRYKKNLERYNAEANKLRFTMGRASYREIKNALEKYKEWYKGNILENDLKVINGVNSQQLTKTTS